MPAVLFRLRVLGLSGVFPLGVVVVLSFPSPLVDGPDAGVTSASVSSVWSVSSCAGTVDSVVSGMVTTSERAFRRLS